MYTERDSAAAAHAAAAAGCLLTHPLSARAAPRLWDVIRTPFGLDPDVIRRRLGRMRLGTVARESCVPLDYVIISYVVYFLRHRQKILTCLNVNS